MITAASTAAWTAGPASRMPWLCPWILWCRGLAKEGRIRRIWWLAAVHATTIKGTRVYANLEEAKEHVLGAPRRVAQSLGSKTARPLARSARA